MEALQKLIVLMNQRVRTLKSTIAIKQKHDYFKDADLLYARKYELEHLIIEAEKLLKENTGAITESAHFANTMLGEVPLQADSSETGSVRQNEQTVKRNICDIPNCGKVAPMNDIFCADHRH